MKVDFSAGSYAAMGARFAMREHDFASAARLVKMGEVFSPNDETLHFLGRIIARVAPPGVLESTKDERQSSTNRLVTQNF